MKQPETLASKGIDAIVGARVRHRRREKGISAKDLAGIVGVTHMQISHYETGIRRMASARLYAIAQALDVPVAYFFSDLEKQEPTTINHDDEQALEHNTLRRELILELTSKLAFIARNLEDVEVRKALRGLLEIIPDVHPKPSAKEKIKKKDSPDP